MSAGEHETFIKTPKQLITIVLLSFVVPVLLIVMLTQLATGGLNVASNAGDADAVRGRVMPVAAVALAGVAAPRVAKSGEQVFNQVCTACHASNSAVPASPKLGDKAAWAPLIKEGLDTLLADSIKGIRGMPARGGNPDLSDLELARAIVYMANKSGGNLKEPEAPKETAAAPAAAAPAAATVAAAREPSPAPSTLPANAVKTAAATTGAAAAAPAAASGNKGQSVYNTACMACHSTGAAGAPKTGDKAAWAPRLSKGAATLYDHAIKGFNAMPAKGGNTTLADGDVKAAVDYMLAQSK